MCREVDGVWHLKLKRRTPALNGNDTVLLILTRDNFGAKHLTNQKNYSPEKRAGATH